MPPTRRSYLRIVDRIGLRNTAALDVAGECQRGEFHRSIRPISQCKTSSARVVA
jgi:hypothetical protein